MNDIAVIGAIGSLSAGAVASLVALRKVKPESTQIMITAATNLVITQGGVVEDLTKRIEVMEERFAAQLAAAEAALAAEREANAELRQENRDLRSRVDALEAEVAKLKNGGGHG